ncbi:MAG: hypothetical protein IPN39_00840 [Chitinophagaceae bacterium]|nr:hypothetical protein [Chitinophagaceae bacterium]MBL0304514.1 hypothetical protein [Chitinophagaceae bacterium]
MRKTILAVLVLLSANFYTVNLFAQGKLLAKEGQAIPDSFGKKTTTMLVFNTGNFQVNNCLEKTFEKYYTGKYEIIDEMQEGSKRYSDTVKYKYAFITYVDDQPGKWVRGQGTGFQRQGPSSNYSYGVLDRATSKEYRISFFGGAYKGLMEAYVKKLEQERKKNEQ